MTSKIPSFLKVNGPITAITAITAIAAIAGCAEDERPSPAGAEVAEAPASDGRPVVLFLGTSLTEGQGVAAEDAYPALIQGKLDSAGLDARVANAGVSGETSASGLRRLGWLLRQRVDVLVLELGANDGIRGQDVDSMRANLQEIVDRTRAAYPEVAVVIAGMEAPPNLGARYTDRFRSVFRELAERNDATLIPFLLDGVAAVDELNQADGIHPNAAGHSIMAQTVWEVLEPVLRGGTAEPR